MKLGATSEGIQTKNLPYAYSNTYILTRATADIDTSGWGDTAKVRASTYYKPNLSQIVLYLYKTSAASVDVITLGY